MLLGVDDKLDNKSTVARSQTQTLSLPDIFDPASSVFT